MASSDLQRAIAQAKRRHASPRKIKALVEAALVESGGKAIKGGDRDSTGILQQRPSQGWGPVGESVEKDVDQFLAHADQADTGKGSAGQLAQRVQRSAFPGRYDQRSGDAKRILGSAGSSGSSAPSGGGSKTTTTTRNVQGFDKAGYDAATKKQVLAQLLSSRHGSKGSVLLRTGAISTAPVDKAQYTTTKQVTDTKTTPSSSPSSPDSGSAGSSKGKSPLLELIHKSGNGPGYAVKDGKKVNGPQFYGAVWNGHADHVHVGAGPKTIVALGKIAEQMGLKVGENPHFGGVNPVHTKNSLHYKGEAIDVSGEPKLMDAYARRLERSYGIH